MAASNPSGGCTEGRGACDPSDSLGSLEADDFACCICTELLFQPVVNRCGHTFCFGCFHHSMNSLGTSKCPLCRTLFQHFPGVCWALSHIIAGAFPRQYRERAAALHSDPTYKCALSRTTTTSHAGDNPVSWAQALLACVSCTKLVRHAVSFNCGHLLCATCAAREREDHSGPAIGEAVLLQGWHAHAVARMHTDKRKHADALTHADARTHVRTQTHVRNHMQEHAAPTRARAHRSADQARA
jgi:hypothetical protein